MSRASRKPEERARTRESVQQVRERLRAAGRILVQTDLPRDLVEAIDQIKFETGARGRTPIIEEAIRSFIEQQQQRA